MVSTPDGMRVAMGHLSHVEAAGDPVPAKARLESPRRFQNEAWATGQ
jgi:hypothetical protein